jgi:hypothetical protein
VHLLTGVNGTGKTRLLASLAAFLGNHTPLTKRFRGAEKIVLIHASRDPRAPGRPSLSWGLTVAVSSSSFQTGGDEVTSQRWASTVPAFAYDGAAYVSDAPIKAVAGLPVPPRQECLSFIRPADHSAPLLQAIANLNLQAALNLLNRDAGGGAGRPTEIVRMLEDALIWITGQQFRFEVKVYPEPTLRVKWANVDMPFDTLPDGLRSIIGWMVDAVVMVDAQLQGKGSLKETEAVFLIDEVESHLHPAWQRRVLPAFQLLFPKAQMFVATHSPFVISSLTHGWIHPLSLEKDGRVKVRPPVAATAGESYISVIEDIMGLEEWYDPETEKLLAEFRAERDRAYGGDAEARGKAVRLAEDLSTRSMELRYMMGRELNQMERQLAKAPAK